MKTFDDKSTKNRRQIDDDDDDDESNDGGGGGARGSAWVTAGVAKWIEGYKWMPRWVISGLT